MTCMWTESLGTCIENKVDNIQIQCENNSEKEPDEYGRAYCSIHRKIVDEINKTRHKNCINKEKLINFIITTLKENKESNSSDLFKLGKESVLFNLQIYINEGDFDND